MEVSTSTIIAPINLEINLEWLYTILDVPECISEIRMRNQKSFQKTIEAMNLPRGTITMVQLRDELKGFKIKKKKSKYFRNALSVVIFVDKLITMKIPKKGKLQMTGCKSEEHAKNCIRVLWDHLSRHEQSEQTYMLCGDTVKAYLHTVMTDIVFKFDFGIHRQKLDQYMNRNTDFHSLLETSFGYTGVNIKKPYLVDYNKDTISTYEYVNGQWTDGVIPFKEWLNTLTLKERDKHMNKEHKNTFLVFHSGRVIMSGKILYYMVDEYNKFVSIIENARQEIEEKIPINKWKQ